MCFNSTTSIITFSIAAISSLYYIIKEGKITISKICYFQLLSCLLV